MAKSSGFKFSVKVKMNSVNKIIKDHGLDSNGRATRFLRDETDRLMGPFVPGGAGGELERLKSYPKETQIKYMNVDQSMWGKTIRFYIGSYVKTTYSHRTYIQFLRTDILYFL